MMIKTTTQKLLFILALVFLTTNISFANDGGRKKKKTGYQKQTKKFYSEFTADYYENKSQSADPNIEALRAKAKVSINEMDAQQRYIDYLAPSDLNKLPIGFKKQVGNTKIKIAISSAVFTPNYAELTVYAKIEIPQNNNSNGTNTAAGTKTIFFGISGLKLAKEGGIIGDAKLVLLGDYAIPLSGNKSSLILKGGMNMNTGQATSKTYINMDCNGFKEIGIAAAVEFPRSLLEPLNAQGDVMPTGQVRGDFGLVVSNWNDILTDISFPSFQIKGIDGVGFKIDNAVIDLSDLKNSATIVYPQGYQQKYLGNDPTTLPLWRGVYAKEITVTLPKSFANRDNSNRVTFGTQNLLIDNNGLTGLFYGENIIKLNKGSAGGWQFSLDSMRIAIEANRLQRAGFGGRIGLPINKQLDSDADVLDSLKLKNRYLAYSGVFSTTGDYLCRVLTKDSIAFDVWKASVLLKPNSYIELSGNKTQFKPSAMLNGEINLIHKTGVSVFEDEIVFDFGKIEFQGLLIKNTPPKLSAQYFGYSSNLQKIGKFPVSIDSIALKSFASDEIGIGFNLRINLQNAEHNGFGGRTRLYVIGKHSEESQLSKWKFDRFKIDEIDLNATIGPIGLKGKVSFFDGSPYGKGFTGSIEVLVKANDTFKVTSNVTFGNCGYRYWYVDGKIEFPGSGIPFFYPINVNGVGGGAYYRMKREGTDVNNSTGIKYSPDSTAGLGLRFILMFNLINKKLDHGEMSLDIDFNRGGGLRSIGLFGYMKFMKELSLDQLPGGSIANKLVTQYQKIEKKLEKFTRDILGPEGVEFFQRKIFNPTSAAKEYDFPDSTTFDVDFRAIIGMNYDFNNKIFHANFDLYASTPGNVISGIGEGGRAGWAVLHIEQSKWYMHMGTPTDPIGIKIGLGPISVNTSAYFMLGHDLPAFPPLPSALLVAMQQAGLSNQPNITTTEKNEIKDGKGIAFGAGMNVNTGDIAFLILYANFSAGMGFDVMIKDYSAYTCAETGKVPGMNGWYAQGRVYAYLQGEAGVRIKLGPVRKKIPVIKGAAVALLEARLPSPTWVGGLFAINASILGGKVKVNVKLKFSFGDNCTLQTNALENQGDIIFDEFRVVTSVTPSNNTQNVSLFARPEIICSTAPNKPFNLPADENVGGADETYRANLDSIYLTQGDNFYSVKYKFSDDGTKITVFPDSALKPQMNYKLFVNIKYQKLISGNWVNVTENGVAAIENTEVAFKTSDNPPFIADENIGFMYPFKNQQFYLRHESRYGRILLYQNQDALFNSFTNWKALIYKVDNTTNQNLLVGETKITYDAQKKLITYPTNTTYNYYWEEVVPIPDVQPNFTKASLMNNLNNFEMETFINLKSYLLSTNFYIPEDVKQTILNIIIDNDGNLDYIKQLLTEYLETLDEETETKINEGFLLSVENNELEASLLDYFVEKETIIHQGVAENPTFLENSKEYKILIKGVGVKPSAIVTDTTQPILTFNFKTSNYNTLAHKIGSLTPVQHIVGRVESDVIDLQVKVNNYEGFEAGELVTTQYTGVQPLIVGEAILEDDPAGQSGNSYYLSKIKQLLNYPNFFTTQGITISRPVNQIGIVPVRSIFPSNYYLNAVQGSTYSSIVKDRFPFIYDVNRIFNNDFIDLRVKIVNKYLSNMTNPPSGPMYNWIRPRWYLPKVPVLTQEWRDYYNSPAYQTSMAASSAGILNIPTNMRTIVTSPFPFMTMGDYKAKFSIRLPVQWDAANTGKFIYNFYNPVYFNFKNQIQ